MKKADRVYRLAALDMDGTLLNSDHALSPFTRAALKKAADAGRYIALCTGRCLAELWTYLDDNPAIGYVIGENGGCLYDAQNHRVIRQLILSEDISGRILGEAEGWDVCIQVFLDNRSFMHLPLGADFSHYHLEELAPVFEGASRFVDDIRACWQEHGCRAEKINLYFSSLEDRERFRPLLEPYEIGLFDSLGVGFEISPPEATKAAGLIGLCQHLGVDPADAMAVGDGGNDVDLMTAAGFSVAMGNAVEPVRMLADAMTWDCDHDGAARAILRYMGLEDI